MNRITLRRGGLLLLTLLCLTASTARAAETALIAPAVPELGQPAPGFSLPALGGKTHRLEDYRGRTVVLEWINLDCPFVVNHYGNTGQMPALQARLRKDGVVWLSVCSSAPGKQGNFDTATLGKRLAANGWKADAYLLDTDGTVGRRYAAKTTPHCFVIDASGRLVYDGSIDSEPGTKPESIAKAQNHVEPIVRALLQGKPVEPRRTKPYGCGVKY